MQVHVTMNSARLTALLDSGSTHNFIDMESARHGGVQLRHDLGMSVVVTNEDRLVSSHS
jgi:hypothetical protein